MTWSLVPALVSAGVGVLGGLAAPVVVGRLPEPEPDPDPEPGTVDGGLVPAEDEADYAKPLDEPKETYADLAARRGVRIGLLVASVLVSGLVGARLGWSPALLFLLYLVPVGVALAVVDWRTRYLPTRLIHPSYAVVGVLLVAATVVDGQVGDLVGALIGLVGSYAAFFLLWFASPRSMAYGDVRLAGLLGLALGWLGIAQVVLAFFTAFLLLAVGGIVLSLVKVFHRKHMPFGPFLLVGALLGAVFPLQVLTVYAAVVTGVASAIGAVVDAF